MINYIIRLVFCGIAVYVMPNYLKGIWVDSITTAMIVAVVMSLLNTFVKPVLSIISFPITLLTLGLFYFVVTVAVVYICAYFVKGFSVEGFLPPLIFSLALSAVNWLVSLFQE